MARPDYCPVGNEPCQSMCDEPCSWQGSKRKKEDDSLILQLVEALEKADKISGYPNNRKIITAGRARLEGKP